MITALDRAALKRTRRRHEIVIEELQRTPNSCRETLRHYQEEHTAIEHALAASPEPPT